MSTSYRKYVLSTNSGLNGCSGHTGLNSGENAYTQHTHTNGLITIYNVGSEGMYGLIKYMYAQD